MEIPEQQTDAGTEIIKTQANEAFLVPSASIDVNGPEIPFPICKVCVALVHTESNTAPP